MNNNEYSRLLELKDLMKTQSVSSEEKKEYMQLLYQNGNITKEQFDSFLDDKNSDDIVKAALVIGGILLAAWLIKKIID